MRNLIFGAFISSVLIFGSCSKEKDIVSSSFGTSIFEVSMSNPPAISKTTPIPIAKDFEMKAHNITMFVYESGAEGDNKPVYVRSLTDHEVSEGTAVFAIENMDHTKSYDFYAVANCGFTAEELAIDGTASMTRAKMIEYAVTANGLFDGGDDTATEDSEYGTDATGLGAIPSVFGSLLGYNGIYGAITVNALRGLKDRDASVSSDNYDGFGDAISHGTTKLENKGFVMTGKNLNVTMAVEGTNTPTPVDIELSRTVAKVEVIVKVSDAILAKYDDKSTLKITGACLTNLAAKTPLMSTDTYNTANFGTAATITQVPQRYDDNVAVDSDTDTGAIITGTGGSYKSQFYIYENSNGTEKATGMAAVTNAAGDNSTSFQPVLELDAEFYLFGKTIDPDGVTNITYTIPLSGEAADIEGTEAPFGLFKRNGYYRVTVTIEGLSDNEIFAKVTILDWATMKEQNVVIGK